MASPIEQMPLNQTVKRCGLDDQTLAGLSTRQAFDCCLDIIDEKSQVGSLAPATLEPVPEELEELDALETPFPVFPVAES